MRDQDRMGYARYFGSGTHTWLLHSTYPLQVQEQKRNDLTTLRVVGVAGAFVIGRVALFVIVAISTMIGGLVTAGLLISGALTW